MKRWLLAALVLPALALAQSPSPDPMDAEALRAFKAGDYATARSLFEVIAAKNPNDKKAQTYLRAIAAKEKAGPADLETTLRAIIIPKVDFQDVSARSAVAFVAQRVSELTDGKQILNVVWIMPAENDPHITLCLQSIPASEVMKYIAEASSLKLDYDPHAVKISPLNPAASPSPAK